MGFLSEATTVRDVNGNANMTSSFIECIVVATMCGRALSHRHQSMVDNTYMTATREFWDRHEWISAIVNRKIEIFSVNYPFSQQEADPMLLFIGLMWWTTVLYLYKLMKSVMQSADENRSTVMDYTRRSSVARSEILKLTNQLSQLNFMKVNKKLYHRI